MDNNVSMTRVQPASPPKVESAPRQQPAAPSPPPVTGNAPERSSPTLPAAQPTEVERMDLEALQERVGELISEFSRQSGRELEFQVSNESNRVVILVKSSETGEVVRSIPPEQVQRLAEALAAGEPALVDQRA